MKQKLVVDEKGKIIYNNIEIPRKDINSNWLDDIFQKALKDEIEFSIDETDLISLLFKRISDETKETSIFSQQISGLRAEYTKIMEDKKVIESAETEDDLPF